MDQIISADKTYTIHNVWSGNLITREGSTITCIPHQGKDYPQAVLWTMVQDPNKGKLQFKNVSSNTVTFLAPSIQGGTPLVAPGDPYGWIIFLDGNGFRIFDSQNCFDGGQGINPITLTPLILESQSQKWVFKEY